jgi:hypothetical protein
VSDIPDNPNVGNTDKAFIDFLRKANLEKEQRLIVMTERIRSLEAQLAATKLKWQKGKPPKDGWYWFRKPGVRGEWVAWHDCGRPIAEYFVWAGPIPEPEEEKP